MITQEVQSPEDVAAEHAAHMERIAILKKVAINTTWQQYVTFLDGRMDQRLFYILNCFSMLYTRDALFTMEWFCAAPEALFYSWHYFSGIGYGNEDERNLSERSELKRHLNAFRKILGMAPTQNPPAKIALSAKTPKELQKMGHGMASMGMPPPVTPEKMEVPSSAVWQMDTSDNGISQSSHSSDQPPPYVPKELEFIDTDLGPGLSVLKDLTDGPKRDAAVAKLISYARHAKCPTNAPCLVEKEVLHKNGNLCEYKGFVLTGCSIAMQQPTAEEKMKSEIESRKKAEMITVIVDPTLPGFIKADGPSGMSECELSAVMKAAALSSGEDSESGGSDGDDVGK
jgi:hypothetical protein